MVALCSKTYYVWGDKNKASSKGLQQRRNSEVLSKERYLQCLFNRETIDGTNKGFRFVDKLMKTYEQRKIGLTPYIQKVLLWKMEFMLDQFNLVPNSYKYLITD